LRGKPRRAKKTAGRKNTIENNAMIHDIRRINWKLRNSSEKENKKKGEKLQPDHVIGRCASGSRR